MPITNHSNPLHATTTVKANIYGIKFPGLSAMTILLPRVSKGLMYHSTHYHFGDGLYKPDVQPAELKHRIPAGQGDQASIPPEQLHYVRI